MLTKIKKWR